MTRAEEISGFRLVINNGAYDMPHCGSLYLPLSLQLVFDVLEYMGVAAKILLRWADLQGGDVNITEAKHIGISRAKVFGITLPIPRAKPSIVWCICHGDNS